LSFIEFFIFFLLRDARIPFLVYDKLTFTSMHIASTPTMKFLVRCDAAERAGLPPPLLLLLLLLLLLRGLKRVYNPNAQEPAPYSECGGGGAGGPLK
jgi:hypothetical protein